MMCTHSYICACLYVFLFNVYKSPLVNLYLSVYAYASIYTWGS